MGNLYVVATPIGNLSDITTRAIETLKDVNMILCEDTRTSLKLLNHFNIKNKLISYHKFNELNRVDSIIKDLKDGKNIALISDAGTPCISDPGYIIVKEARNEGINVYGIGGISAAITALSISGLNSDNFTFYGFFPKTKNEQSKLIKNIKDSFVNTFIFYESPKRIIRTLEFMEKEFLNVKVSVSKELTKMHEKNFYGSIKEVLEKLKNDPKTEVGEYTFIIEKESEKREEKTNFSIEALLIDEMIKNKISLKEAINNINEKHNNISKKEIYNASLNLKDIL